MSNVVDIKELNDRIQRESSFVDMINNEQHLCMVATVQSLHQLCNGGRLVTRRGKVGM